MAVKPIEGRERRACWTESGDSLGGFLLATLQVRGHVRGEGMMEKKDREIRINWERNRVLDEVQGDAEKGQVRDAEQHF